MPFPSKTIGNESIWTFSINKNKNIYHSPRSLEYLLNQELASVNTHMKELTKEAQLYFPPHEPRQRQRDPQEPWL